MQYNVPIHSYVIRKIKEWIIRLWIKTLSTISITNIIEIKNKANYRYVHEIIIHV